MHVQAFLGTLIQFFSFEFFICKLFPLSTLRTLEALQQSLEWWFKQKSNLGHRRLGNRLKSDTGNVLNDYAVIMASHQSSSVSSLSCTCSDGNHVKMHVHASLLFSCFSDAHNFGSGQYFLMELSGCVHSTL